MPYRRYTLFDSVCSGRQRCLMPILLLLSAVCFQTAAFELDFLEIKPEYKIYFGRRRRVENRIYFLSSGDKVLAVAVGKVPFLGNGSVLRKRMLERARIDAQKKIERFTSSKFSAKECYSATDKAGKMSTMTHQEFRRAVAVWKIIGSGLSADGKRFGCVIGKVFPKTQIPESLLE